jgi:hypothetical protein
MRFLLIVAAVLGAATPAYAGPEIHVRIASVDDAAERASHVDAVKRSLRDVSAHSIDVVVSKLVVARNGQVIAKIDVVLSNAGGIRAIASGSATFVARKHQLKNPSALRREALDCALEAVQKKFRATTRPVS